MSRRNALDVALDQPGYLRMAPHDFKIPEASGWFELCGLLAKRRLAEVETLDSICRDISLQPVVAQNILDLISAHATTRIGKHYVETAGGLMPPLPLRDAVWLDANEIGRAIYQSAQHQTHVARHALSIFAAAASLDRQIVITVGSEKHLRFARFLISFVKKLAINGLGIGLVAYKNEIGMHADLEDLCRVLRLDPKTTPTRTENARNFKAVSPARQAGLEVLRITRASAVTDQAFFSAMILGAAVEMWRFALPAAAMSATETSDQPISSRPKPTDPTLKLPPAYARPSIDRDALRESLQRGDPG
jgi:hypothetical protein